MTLQSDMECSITVGLKTVDYFLIEHIGAANRSCMRPRQGTDSLLLLRDKALAVALRGAAEYDEDDLSEFALLGIATGSVYREFGAGVRRRRCFERPCAGRTPSQSRPAVGEICGNAEGGSAERVRTIVEVITDLVMFRSISKPRMKLYGHFAFLY